MIRGPEPGRSQTDFHANARRGWGDVPPDWIVALAEEATRTSTAEVGKRIGYVATVVGQVISAKYGGNLAKVEAMVRGAFMAETVMCPVLDVIGRDRCRQEQSRPFAATNSTRARLRRACKTCPHKEGSP
jgi:predicted phage gp36 major capsid-like protein